MVRIVCISDTHMKHNDLKVPDGDILIHAGDYSSSGALVQAGALGGWLKRMPHKHIVISHGNHDRAAEENPRLVKETILAAADRPGVHVLIDEAVELAGLHIWGTPWTPRFHDWAFNVDRGGDLRQRWALIPNNTDVLVTHGPPIGLGDQVELENVGDADLLNRILEIKPKLHVYGHIHEGYGTYTGADTIHVNASICRNRDRELNQPIVIDL